MALQITNIFIFVIPWLVIVSKDTCYASTRPDYFWPVKEGEKATEGFVIKNVSRRWAWIFFLGLLTYIGQIVIEKVEAR